MPTPQPGSCPTSAATADAPPKILVLTSGTTGDLLPFMALAQDLRRRGHDALLLVPRMHEETVRASGLPFEPFGTEAETQAVLNDPDLWHERKGLGVVWRGLVPHLMLVHDIVSRLPPHRPCKVLCHPFLAPIAALARQVRPDLRIVSAFLAPSNLRTVHDPLTIGVLNVPVSMPQVLRQALWRTVDRVWVDPDLLPTLNAARHTLGLPAVRHFLPHMQSVADASVGLFPDWFAPRQPDWPGTFIAGDFVYAQQSGDPSWPAELDAFLSAGDAPIAFTPGTGHRHAASYFANALSALNAMGRRGLFITPHAAQLPPELPPQVLWIPSAPFQRLLPHVAALVHHGGIGTTAEALRAGTPQLILPYAFDQFDNGQRVRRLGAGAVLPATKASPRRLRMLLAALLASPTTGQPNAALKDRQQGPGRQALINNIELALQLRATP